MEMENSDEEIAGASSVDDTEEEEESGGSSSENETEIAGNKRHKLEEGKEDMMSVLPDPLIQHILSFLPSTTEAIRTGILSKRWKNQWTRVAILIFDSTGMSDINFSQFVDRTLTQHDCSKIKKFHIEFHGDLENHAQLTSIIHFATRKNVEELFLQQYNHMYKPYVFPKFLLNNDSLVKLDLSGCQIMYDERVNWPSLKELKFNCQYASFNDNVVSGCPLLESLELSNFIRFVNMVIASKSLKRLIFVNVVPDDVREDEVEDKLEISCPNLEILSIKVSQYSEIGSSELPVQTIRNVLSHSPLLHTLELPDYNCSDGLLIASKSLKKLVLGRISEISEFKISCPILVEMNLYRFVPEPWPYLEDLESKSRWERCLGMKILEQLRNVKLLEIGSWFMEILSTLEAEVPSSPLLNCKCLTIDGTNFDELLPGIVSAVRCSPVLETLVLKLQLQPQNFSDLMYSDDCRRNYWAQYSNKAFFNCSVSNLKTVKIIGLSEKDDKHKLMFKFVEFLLKSARMLEKISVILADYGTCFLFEVSKTMLSFQRRFPRTTIELLPSI